MGGTLARFGLEKLLFLFLRNEKDRSGPLGCLCGHSLCSHWMPPEHLYWDLKHPTPVFCVHKALLPLPKESLGRAKNVLGKVPLESHPGIVGTNLRPWTVVRHKMTNPWLSLNEIKSPLEEPWHSQTPSLLPPPDPEGSREVPGVLCPAVHSWRFLWS